MIGRNQLSLPPVSFGAAIGSCAHSVPIARKIN
jgi:hypothetical protein